MDMNSASDGAENAKIERQQAQEEGTRKIIEAMRSCLQISLVGESQNFRSSVAAAHRKFNFHQRLALATTALACLLGALVVWSSVREATLGVHEWFPRPCAALAAGVIAT